MTETATTRKENEMTRYLVVLNEGPDAFSTYDPFRKGLYLRWGYETEAANLEALFETDNLGGRPTAQVQRSLSVGDIVLDQDADEAYVVAIMGFRPLGEVTWPAVGATPEMTVRGMRTFSRHLVMDWDSVPFWEGEDGQAVYGEPHADLVGLREYHEVVLAEKRQPQPVIVKEA